MRSNPVKRHFSALFGAIALTTGLIASCSAIAGKNPAESMSSVEPKMEVNHDGMSTGEMSHNMDLGPADENYDLRFIDGMIPHHEGAVVMAKEALTKSKRPEMLELEKDIIKAQQSEIAMMKTWRKDWYPKASSTPMAWHTKMNHMMGMPPEQMKAMRMDMNLGASDNQFDLRFINAMIPHHEGALTMAKDAIGKSKRPEIQKEAQDILSSQAAEIKQMKQWRRDWYNK
jgi:uncharacterized protein (DUF305 family)